MGKTSRYPSTGEYEYAAIAARAPRLKELHHAVNRALEDMAIAGRSGEICSFKRATAYRYTSSPVSMWRETVRRAWEKSGMRELQVFASGLRATYSKLRSGQTFSREAHLRGCRF